MPTSPLWIEFSGIYIAIIAALIGLAASVFLKRAKSIHRLALVYSLIFQGLGMLMFMVWAMTRYPFPEFDIIPLGWFFASIAFWVLGIVSGVAVGILKITRRPAHAAGSINIGLEMGLVSLLLLISSGLLWGAAQCTPKALRETRYSHFVSLGKQGIFALPQITAGLNDRSPAIRSEACSFLTKLGPPAEAALPYLLSFIQDHQSDDIDIVSEAINAYGVIGAGNAEVISELTKIAGQERTNYYHRHAIISALERMGPSAQYEYQIGIEQALELDARQLTRTIAALGSKDPNIVRQAADSLYYMGSYAKPVLPLLEKRLDDMDKHRDRKDSRARFFIERSISHIKKAGPPEVIYWLNQTTTNSEGAD